MAKRQYKPSRTKAGRRWKEQASSVLQEVRKARRKATGNG